MSCTMTMENTWIPEKDNICFSLKMWVWNLLKIFHRVGIGKSWNIRFFFLFFNCSSFSDQFNFLWLKCLNHYCQFWVAFYLDLSLVLWFTLFLNTWWDKFDWYWNKSFIKTYILVHEKFNEFTSEIWILITTFWNLTLIIWFSFIKK